MSSTSNTGFPAASEEEGSEKEAFAEEGSEEEGVVIGGKPFRNEGPLSWIRGTAAGHRTGRLRWAD
ncbi:hypothetical protein GCM10017557_52560 [Streptomyces aurantiacus]|uniref:Uncharacterized protein n=1 Tax=Streptomyces aurantiacus TaxID=47760 RepID=A0A7G1P9K2_9ACTN|nr:hypothetical protein GCM10017557_52560 [Streptomyces aurantiacus]